MCLLHCNSYIYAVCDEIIHCEEKKQLEILTPISKAQLQCCVVFSCLKECKILVGHHKLETMVIFKYSAVKGFIQTLESQASCKLNRFGATKSN